MQPLRFMSTIFAGALSEFSSFFLAKNLINFEKKNFCLFLPNFFRDLKFVRKKVKKCFSVILKKEKKFQKKNFDEIPIWPRKLKIKTKIIKIKSKSKLSI